jgi:hypothetical protein
MIFSDEVIALGAEGFSAPDFLPMLRAHLAEAGIDEARIDEILKNLVPRVRERAEKALH